MNYTPEERQKLLKAQAIQRQEYRDSLNGGTFDAHSTRIVEEARAKRLLMSSPDASRLPPLPEGWGAVEEQPEFLVAE